MLLRRIRIHHVGAACGGAVPNLVGVLVVVFCVYYYLSCAVAVPFIKHTCHADDFGNITSKSYQLR